MTPVHVPPRAILVAVDFGAASDRAISVAGALGAQFDASVIAVHAETFEPPPYFTLEQIASLERERARTWEAARTHLQDVARARTPWPVTARVVDGPAVSGILAASEGADLLVLGTHGRRGPGRWWLGSVAEGVLRATLIPLLVVRADASASAAPSIVATGAGVTVLAGESIGAELALWAQALAAPGEPMYLRGERACSPRDLAAATLVIVPLGADPAQTRIAGEAVQILRECAHPLLFVPMQT